MTDHERFSEMLPDLLDGRLAPDEATELEAHLAGCDECRAERRGLELLRSDQGEGLTASERGTLERGVMTGIAGEPEPATVVPLAPRRRFGARVAGALGAAAVVALFATFVYFGTSGGGDSGESASGGADTADVQQESGTAEGGGGGSDDRALDAGEEEPEAVADTGAGTEAAMTAPAPQFVVEDEPLTGADLQKRGESSLASVRFAAAYRANNDTDEDGRTLLEQLVDAADAAAGPEVAEQVEECASQVLDTEDPTIPTFGSIGELDGRDVLVLGFAWSRESSGSLDRYMVWAWERGSCDVAVDFIDGKIETAN